MLAGYPYMNYSYGKYRPESESANGSHCFQLFGVDVILDQDFKPWLIEVGTRRFFILESWYKRQNILKFTLIHLPSHKLFRAFVTINFHENTNINFTATNLNFLARKNNDLIYYFLPDFTHNNIHNTIE